jgi:hypothetical protein
LLTNAIVVDDAIRFMAQKGENNDKTDQVVMRNDKQKENYNIIE